MTQKAKQIEEEKKKKKKEKIRKKEDLRRLNQKKYVEGSVNEYLKKAYKQYQEKQQAIEGSGEGWRDREDDANTVIGEVDDDDYTE